MLLTLLLILLALMTGSTGLRGLFLITIGLLFNPITILLVFIILCFSKIKH